LLPDFLSSCSAPRLKSPVRSILRVPDWWFGLVVLDTQDKKNVCLLVLYRFCSLLPIFQFLEAKSIRPNDLYVFLYMLIYIRQNGPPMFCCELCHCVCPGHCDHKRVLFGHIVQNATLNVNFYSNIVINSWSNKSYKAL
jgi:hypothetical protein